MGTGAAPASGATPRDHRRALAVVFLVAAASALVLFAYSIHAALAYNPIKLPYEKSARIQFFLPQGWKFFTRDPREEREGFFRLNASGTWEDASTGANAEPAHLFGLNRGSRAQGVEFGLLAQMIPQSAFVPCEEAPTRCLDRAPEKLNLKNPSPMPTLCGTIGIVLQKPVPWAWVASENRIHMPSRVVRLKIAC